MGVLQSTASVTLLVYLTLAVPQVVLQLVFAYRGALRQRPGGEGPTPPVDLIVPCFNEPPVTLAACLQSLAAQDYSGLLTVWLVDDGSANREAVREVYARFAHREDFHLIALDRNVGKRHAQAAAISIRSSIYPTHPVGAGRSANRSDRQPTAAGTPPETSVIRLISGA
jgi:N-acetylglucosaminyltransferase